MGRRVVGNLMQFWDKGVPYLLELLYASGYVWGYVTYLESNRNSKTIVPDIEVCDEERRDISEFLWEKGLLRNRIRREKTNWFLHNPSKLTEQCVPLSCVDLNIFPYKPPILSRILVPSEVAQNIFDPLVRKVGLKINAVFAEEVTGDPGFEVWLAGIENDQQNGIEYEDTMLPYDDERIKLLTIYITAARACPRSSAPARRSGRAAGRRSAPSARQRTRGTSGSDCGSRRACRPC